MGDCLLKIQISKHLLKASCLENVEKKDEEGAPDVAVDDHGFFSLSTVFTADSTVRDVVETELFCCLVDGKRCSVSILPLLEVEKASLWDCTIFPATNITDVPLEEFAETRGKRSRTLYEAGWYPSGSLQILPAGQSHRGALAGHYEWIGGSAISPRTAVQRALNPSFGEGAELPELPVQLMGVEPGGSVPKPSEVLESVTKRFEEDDQREAEETETARLVRQQNRKTAAQKQQDRFRRLEQRIQKLEDGEASKNQKVSNTVRRMLIKSRATGRVDLEADDRVYLHCILVTDDDDGTDGAVKEDYRYFSRQDTVGRALSAFSEAASGKEAEMLVRVIQCSEGEYAKNAAPVYGRLPVLMRFYEAVSQKHLSRFDKVIIRFFDPTKQGATMSVADMVMSVGDHAAETAMTEPIQKDEGLDATESGTDQQNPNRVTNTRLSEALRTMEDPAKKKKKSTAAAEKVRQMQMKSKAKGDAKRVKMTDRFFLELITAIDDGECCVVSAAPVFQATMDKMNRVVRDCAKQPDGSWSWELLIPVVGDKNSQQQFDRISPDDAAISWEEAEKKKIVKPFDRVILRFFPS